MKTEVLKIRRYKVGYEIRTELCTFEDNGYATTLKSTYTVPDGYYIGSNKWAHRLIVQRGIKPESRPPSCSNANGNRGRTCSIGFCEKEQKWYGWSHRAIYGFAIGDVVKEGDCCASSGWTDEYLYKYPEEDKSLPIAFAESIS